MDLTLESLTPSVKLTFVFISFDADIDFYHIEKFLINYFSFYFSFCKWIN
jgi:DNA gyrase/topoisomerase IV subunit B